MPNWTPIIDCVFNLQSPAHWLSISMIREQARRLSLESGTDQRPSVPCLKNEMLHRLDRRRIVGKVGPGSACYFLRSDRFVSGSGGPSLPSYISGEARRRARNFNALVDVCWNNNLPLPSPWEAQETLNRAEQILAQAQIRTPAPGSTGPSSSSGIPITSPPVRNPPVRNPRSGPSLMGSIPEETLSVMEGISNPEWNLELTRPVRGILEVLGISRDRVPLELRPYLRPEDIFLWVGDHFQEILQKAQARSPGPLRTLEQEFFGRMEKK